MKRFKIGGLVFESMLMPFDGSGSYREPQGYWRLGSSDGVTIQGPPFPLPKEAAPIAITPAEALIMLTIALGGKEVTE